MSFRMQLEIHQQQSEQLSVQDTESLRQFIRTLRQNRGVTSREVARRMGLSSKTGYLQYEQGRRSPTLEQLEKIIRAIEPEAAITLTIAISTI